MAAEIARRGDGVKDVAFTVMDCRAVYEVKTKKGRSKDIFVPVNTDFKYRITESHCPWCPIRESPRGNYR